MDEKDHLLIIASCAVIILSVFALILTGFGSGNKDNRTLKQKVYEIVTDTQSFGSAEEYVKFMSNIQRNIDNPDSYDLVLADLKSYCLTLKSDDDKVKIKQTYDFVRKEVKGEYIKARSGGSEATTSAFVWYCP